MANLRIVARNAARRAVLAASITAGLLVVTNLQTDKKSEIWRATGPAATISGTVSAPELASCVALLGNFSPSTTIRVRLYSDEAGTNQVLDTGIVLACPAPAIELEGWTAAQAASAYAYGGGAIARIWFAQTSWRKFVIDIVDTNNLQGYIEAAHLVVGAYWSPAYNATAASAVDVDNTEHYRTAAGDLMSRASTIHRKVPIELKYMEAADRAKLANILRGSRAYPIFLSVFPGHSDPELERDHMIIGKRMSDSEVEVQAAISYGSKLEVESI
jgi:hypothetical protein